MRKLISPTFHKYDILEDFLQIMNEQSEILVSKLSEMVSKKHEINIYNLVGLCSLDIIMGLYL